jgi:hypothetical protein
MNSDGLLKPCPSAATQMSLVETLPEDGDENMYLVTVAVAIWNQRAHGRKKRAIHDWNQRDMESSGKITISNPAGSVELAHQQALTWVCDAYLFHLVSLHRRPVYRHQYGDISLNQPALQGFIDSYLKIRMDMEKRRAHYINILDLIRYMHRKNSDFIDWGTVPSLTPRGLRWMNACFSRLGYGEQLWRMGRPVANEKSELVITVETAGFY